MRRFLSSFLLLIAVSNLFAETVGEALNTNVMHVSYYCVQSPDLRRLRSAGGWADVPNMYKHIGNLNFTTQSRRLDVRVSGATTTANEDGIAEHPVYIVNTTNDTLFFNAQDSQLYMNLQAKDKFGVWRDIEYIRPSTCGNSYHTRFLPPNHYWSLSTPVFQGEHNTVLRLKLLYRESLDADEKIVFSNVFAGSVNPGQFWRK